ncbi:MAG: hypothetical protein WCS03_16535 [Bacteroidota bacterium]
MENKEFTIELNTYQSSEVKELIDLIRSYNLKGLTIEGHKERIPIGELAVPEFTNILSVVLNCAAISISLKGLFDLIKTNILTRRNKEVKIKYKEYEIELKKFDNKELNDFIQILQK